MKTDRREIENRIHRLDKVMNEGEELVEKAFDALDSPELQEALKNMLPEKVVEKFIDEQGQLKRGPEAEKKIQQILDKVLRNEELKDLIAGIKNKRPPRLVIAGEQGIGKSSLINALLDEYAVEVGEDYGAKTLEAEKNIITANGDKVLELLDTRGLDDYTTSEKSSANRQLKKDINEFRPDLILFVLHARREAYQKASFKLMKQLQEHAGGIPIITVLNKADELAPKEKGKPVYNNTARQRFAEVKQEIKKRLEDNNVTTEHITVTSAYVEWDDARENIEYETFYGIDELYEILTGSLELEAKINFQMHSRIEDIIFEIAHQLSWSFAGAATLIGGAHFIPFSDMYVLLPYEIILVMIIAYISGQPMEPAAAKELLNAAGLTGGLAYFSKLSFQQIVKFIPGKGTAVAAAVAGAGVYAIGMVAAYYFVRGKEIKLQNLYEQLFKLFKNNITREGGKIKFTPPELSDLPGE